jgi:hypothetical protein
MATTLAAPMRLEVAASNTLPYVTAEIMAGVDRAP